MASLQEQLLKAGIVDSKKAKKLDKEKRKEARSQPKGHQRVDVTRERVQQAMAEKAERDRELNRQQQAVSEQKAIQAQIAQLIAMNRIERTAGDIAYQFTDGRKIKKIQVTPRLQDELARGRVAIVQYAGGYALVPAAAARKIMQRDDSVVVLLNADQPLAADEEDPYAAYQIPDDLMW